MLRPACLLALLAALPAAAQPDRVDRPGPGELRKLHVLVVADTAGDLRESVSADRSRVHSLFDRNIPDQRLAISHLDGKQVTRAAVLAHVRKLKPGREDGVVFYFAGHGALDSKRGHYLQMQPAGGPPLLRSELRRALQDTGAGLVVLLTDCCSNKVDIPPVVGSPPGKGKDKMEIKPLHPTIRQLFFLRRGVVDITGAQAGTASWGDDRDGGVFTRVLCRVLTDPAAGMDSNRDGRLTWDEAFLFLRLATSMEFRRWKSSQTLATRGRIKQAGQSPQAFLLGDSAPAGPGSAGPAPKSKKD